MGIVFFILFSRTKRVLIHFSISFPLDVENDAAHDAFTTLRRALQLAAVLARNFSLFGNHILTFRRRGAGRNQQTFLLALVEVSIPDFDDDALRDNAAQIPVHHLEDEAAVQPKMLFNERSEQTAVVGRLEFVGHFQEVADEFLHVLGIANQGIWRK